MYFGLPHLLPAMCLSLGANGIIADFPSGKLPTTRVLRQIEYSG